MPTVNVGPEKRREILYGDKRLHFLYPNVIKIPKHRVRRNLHYSVIND